MLSYSKGFTIVVITFTIILCCIHILYTQPIHDKPALEKEASQLRIEVYRLINDGKHRGAIPKAERLVRVAEQVLGSNHPSIATILDTLADLYEAVGQESAARDRRNRAFQINLLDRRLEKDPDVELLLVQSKEYFDRGDYETRGLLFYMQGEFYKVRA